MPLDTGHLSQAKLAEGAANHDFLEAFAPTVDQGAHVGEALRAAREYHGVSLERLAEITKVRAPYLAAIEEMRLADLPSRPFVAGYIRAYARALGLDGDLAAARFNAAGPVGEARLPNPLGVEAGSDNRVGLVFTIGLVLIGAIVLWNVVQRLLPDAPTQAQIQKDAVEQAALKAPSSTAGPGGAVVSLGPPLPAPVESTIPPAYETPGLAAATAAALPGDTVTALPDVRPPAPPVPPPAPPEGPFAPNGQVFGAAPEASVVTLQARRPTSIIVRRSDAQVVFARQLAEGEAYRVPAVAGLVVDCPMPDAIDVYVGGQGKSILPAGVTPVGKLVGS
ncbi:MAG: helix-turn-helix domain-containing protein [Caulobacteraceae bacterium]|nr:helix-turn-helix domain-containing protein [Caulobacteraceae bacterium]